MEQYRILHEDEDILIVDKLGALPVQPEKTGDPSLQDLLRAELAARKAGPAAGEVFLEAANRIDRRVSGAVVFAKTHRALETLDADFRGKHIDKYYIACVEHEPEPHEGRFEHRLVWDKRRNVVRAFRLAAKDEGSKGERGILEYRLAGASERYWFLEVKLITGKHHQIRAQLAAEGLPIRGDIKYGARRTNRNGLLMLHSYRIVLTQPRTRETLDIVAPFPDTEPLWAALALPGAGTDAAPGAASPAPGAGSTGGEGQPAT
jgi:23S rRNA pseudouridine1911/1915/1917 synthase